MGRTRGRICVTEWLRASTLILEPPQKKRCLRYSHPSAHVIGAAYRMISSHLTRFTAGTPQNDFEVAVPLARAGAALQELKRRATEDHLCLPLMGVFLRFTRADESTLIAHSVADGHEFPSESGVLFAELVVYRTADGTFDATDPYFKPYWNALQSLIVNYHGRAHWAKNQADLFKLQRDNNPDFAARLQQFSHIVSEFDPDHRFSNDFSVEVGLSR
jgi:hypothetical protein